MHGKSVLKALCIATGTNDTSDHDEDYNEELESLQSGCPSGKDPFVHAADTKLCHLRLHPVEIMYGPITLSHDTCKDYGKCPEKRVVLVEYMVYGSEHHYDIIQPL